jgi:hypothetical protein
MKAPEWIGRWSEWRRDLAVGVMLGLLLGAMGPFGSFMNQGVVVRVAYWTVAMTLGLAVFSLGLRYALYLGERHQQPIWFVLPLAVAVLAVPVSLASAATVTALWPRVRFYVHPLDWYAQTLVISMPIALVWRYAHRRLLPVAPEPASQPIPSASPVDAAQPVLCLQMEDHYVRIHTASGSRLELSSLRDAIDALGPVEGMQVHRSWWVARSAVVRARRRGRELELELSNGLCAPVSRTSVVRLREADWLEGLEA